ncbi:putative metabolite transport protein [Wickerhamomyces ciferrii]|uniref:Metabolite transport protein n=1 Tax=Wickerhamomyces ciferrii (strain ATCC 14091 / BCRC 22168 / CBS 111 / JCM 3599 / NBRC 0793 / NRRL Y-1031 F-60-10) TaxID=1206466 RepID=K0KKJ0_WICCF|nr:putative metabolite transport protein [Wickerhamomyces ciferrii]CCH41984.1 putative metabolite transport protein [Wickerhamomyces ciferrii]
MSNQQEVIEQQINTKIEIDNPNGHQIKYDGEARLNRYAKKKSISDIFTVIASGVALISDGYQNNLMTMLNALFAQQYAKAYTGDMKTAVSNALLVGEILGQFGIGITCDYMGRKAAIVWTTVMIVIGSIMATAANGVTHTGMFWMLVVSRGLIGVGVGGEYSACSSATSEAANETTKKRGRIFCLVTNLPLSLGGPFAIIVFLIVLSAAGVKHLEVVWRVCFGLGIIWPVSIFYFRYKMAASHLYKTSAMKKNVPYLLVLKYYWPRLLGTCGCWFIYDFVTFPNGIFSSTIIASVLDDTKDLKKVAEWTLLLTIIALPGVILGALVVDKWGRKYCLMVGFSGYLVIGLVIGCAYNKIKEITPLFIIFYGIFNSFGNFGPGNCMGLTSSESYATPVRGTLYGISAAMGKVGAAVGTQCFTKIQENLGKQWTFIIAAILGSVGVVLAFFTIPHLKEDDLLMEDILFEKYLRENGYKGQIGLQDGSSTTDDYSSVERITIDEPLKNDDSRKTSI